MNIDEVLHFKKKKKTHKYVNDEKADPVYSKKHLN